MQFDVTSKLKSSSTHVSLHMRASVLNLGVKLEANFIVPSVITLILDSMTNLYKDGHDHMPIDI